MHNIEQHFTFTGVVEHFSRSIILLQHTYGWKRTRYISHNRTLAGMQPEGLDDATKQIIRETNAGDMFFYDWASARFISQYNSIPLVRYKLIAFNFDNALAKANRKIRKQWRRHKRKRCAQIIFWPTKVSTSIFHSKTKYSTLKRP